MAEGRDEPSAITERHPSKLNDGQRQAIAQMIESGPIPAVHGVVRWRLTDLAQWIFEEFRIIVAKQTLKLQSNLRVGRAKITATTLFLAGRS